MTDSRPLSPELSPTPVTVRCGNCGADLGYPYYSTSTGHVCALDAARASAEPEGLDRERLARAVYNVWKVRGGFGSGLAVARLGHADIADEFADEYERLDRE